MWTCQTSFQNKETIEQKQAAHRCEESGLDGRLKFQQKTSLLDASTCMEVLWDFLGTSMPILQAKRLCPSPTPNRVIHKVTLASPYLGPAFSPYPLFQQSKDILLNLGMKCSHSGRSAETQHLMHKVWD